jgi:diguanylate cyclase (GGDEF)-like protein
VPTIISPGFIIDPATLCVVALFITSTGGFLLLFSWAYNRNTPALAVWGFGYLTGAAGALLGSGLLPTTAWSLCVGNALTCAAYGMMWSGSRSFEGRRILMPWLLAGAVIFIVAFQLDAMSQSLRARVIMVAAISSTYMVMSAVELWHARDRELVSRWPTLAFAVMHAGFLAARIPLALTVNFHLDDPRVTTAINVMAFEALFTTFCIVFLRVSMAKERADLELRRAASTDALTGISNRRAFFDHGGPLLEQTVADRRSAGLLLFDLDRFKQVNDTAGHQTGDYVLRTFAELIATSVRPSGLCARLGGEEFACLLVDVSMAQALQTAEQVRRSFEQQHFPDLAIKTTVSVGVAMMTDAATADAGRGLPALLAAADRALYRAKVEGRNRVAPAPLVLVEAGGEVARRTRDVTKGTVLAAPLAG